MNNLACALARGLVSVQVFCDKRMTGFMTHILVLFSQRDFISVFMRPNTNTIESFESSHALTFSVISLEIVLHAYLFIGQGLRVYPKHFSSV